MSVATIEAGEGEPLVLLHGIGSNAKSWRRQIDDLSKEFRVIAWDAPGYGRSADPPLIPPAMRFYADALLALLSNLNLDRVNLLGHSLGGIVAQEFCRAWPERVSRLILADTTSGGSSGAKLDERLRMIRTMTPAELAEARAPKLLSPHAAPELIREAVAIMSEVRRGGYEFAAVALAQADTRDVFSSLKAPTLLIWGDEDEITPMWPSVPPGAALEVIPGAGHLCYMEQPDRFNAIVRKFLKTS